MGTLVILESVGSKPPRLTKVLVRATNWLGDAVMSLPAIRAIREALPEAHIAVVARPGLVDLYARERRHRPRNSLPQTERPPRKTRLRREPAARSASTAAILLQNAFDAALMAWLARIPVRIGYNRDGRGLAAYPRHSRSRSRRNPAPRALLLPGTAAARRPDRAPAGVEAIRLSGIRPAREAGVGHLPRLGIDGPVIGISPGAAYGNAKRWLPERFAEVGARQSPARCKPPS